MTQKDAPVRKARMMVTAPTTNAPEWREAGGRLISIQLEDATSQVPFLEIDIPVAVWGALLTMGSTHLVDYRLRFVGSLGKLRENKTTEVWVPNDSPLRSLGYEARDKALDVLLADYEVDGWMARRDDVTNMHRHVRSEARNGVPGAVYAVHFTRLVDPPAAAEGKLAYTKAQVEKLIGKPDATDVKPRRVTKDGKRWKCYRPQSCLCSPKAAPGCSYSSLVSEPVGG